ncbi:MAG: hypothetical protein KR126chlam4_00296 [Candidatus Anoxychlamydiales bacterium]|nr:hypothetical protein [Candidatus Anoxychlamydiales bacterium]NGX40474.1 hypothetical protein [Candidatus Anoxychlamydiales bacterium]HEU64738.1 hypothetical protein [Chlamydiota bacterium]
MKSKLNLFALFLIILNFLSTDKLLALVENAKNPQITISDDGVKTYIVWTRSDGIKDVIQMSASQFYGSSFSDPQSISNNVTVYKELRRKKDDF